MIKFVLFTITSLLVAFSHTAGWKFLFFSNQSNVDSVRKKVGWRVAWYISTLLSFIGIAICTVV